MKLNHHVKMALVASVAALISGCSTAAPSNSDVPPQAMPRPTLAASCTPPKASGDLKAPATIIVRTQLGAAQPVGEQNARFELLRPQILWATTKAAPMSIVATKGLEAPGDYVLLLRSDDHDENFYVAGGLYGMFRVDEAGALRMQCLDQDYQRSEAREPVSVEQLIAVAKS